MSVKEVLTKPVKVRGRVTKHYNFEYMWYRYQDLIIALSDELAKVFGGDSKDYLGSIALSFNSSLFFANCYSDNFFKDRVFNYCFKHVKATFVRFESDHMAASWKELKDSHEVLFPYCTFVSHYSVKTKVVNSAGSVFKDLEYKEKETSWALDLIDSVGGNEVMWDIISEHLDSRSKMIIKYKYNKGLNLQQIGDKLGITRERARQILAKAMDTIRRMLKGKKAYSHFFSNANVGDEV